MNAARSALVVALLAVLGAALFAAWPAPAGPQERVERIVAELRCPVCQGLSVADSPSESARQMRDLVAQRIAEGRTDEEVREEFRRSYGDWVFLAPESGGPTALMWLAPLLLLADKVRDIVALAPDAVVTANPGCMLQLEAGLRATGSAIPVLHIVELLDRATNP